MLTHKTSQATQLGVFSVCSENGGTACLLVFHHKFPKVPRSALAKMRRRLAGILVLGDPNSLERWVKNPDALLPGLGPAGG